MSHEGAGKTTFANVVDGPPRSVRKKGVVDFGDEESPTNHRLQQVEQSNSEGKRRTGLLRSSVVMTTLKFT